MNGHMYIYIFFNIYLYCEYDVFINMYIYHKHPQTYNICFDLSASTQKRIHMLWYIYNYLTEGFPPN